MDPILSSALGRAVGAITATLGLTWTRKVTIRWRVTHAASKQLKSQGITVSARSLRIWLKRPDVQSQLELGKSASIQSVTSRLELVLVGNPQQRAASAEEALAVVLHQYLRLCDPGEARVLMSTWQSAHVSTEAALTRQSVEESQRAVLARLDSSTNFEGCLAQLSPWSAQAARELRTQWPTIETVVQQIATSDDRHGLMEQWAISPPVQFETAPPAFWCWLGTLAPGYSAIPAARQFLGEALKRGAFPADYWRVRQYILDDSGPELPPPGLDAHPLHLIVWQGIHDEHQDALKVADEWQPDNPFDDIYRATYRAKLLTLTDRIPEAIAVIKGQLAITASPALMLQQAELLMFEAQNRTSPLYLRQLIDALQLCIAARDLRRQWRGDSVEAIVLGVKAAARGGNIDEAWSLTQLPPDGSARREEAEDPRVVAESGRVALITGRTAHGTKIHSQLPAGFAKLHMEAMMADRDDDRDLAISKWQEAWQHAEDDEQRLLAASGLAENGAILPDLSDLGTRQSSAVAMIRSIQSVMSNTDNLKESLIAHKNDNLIFAMRLESLYCAELEFEKAADVLESAGHRWAHPEVLSLSADRFRRAGRLTDAARVAQAALTLGGAEWSGRGELQLFLIEVMFDLGRTDEATALARALVGSRPQDVLPRWALCHALVARGDIKGAWSALLLDGRSIPPRTRSDARLWILLGSQFSDEPDFVRRTLEILNEYPDDAQLNTGSLMAIMQYMRRDDVKLDNDDVARFQDAFRNNVEKFSGEGGFVAYELGAPEDNFGDIGAVVKQQYEQAKALQNAIADFNVPVGFHARLLKKTYGEAIINKVDRVRVCQNPMAPSDAASAMGDKVVIDLTAVYTLSLLEAPDRDRFVGAFHDLSTTDIQFNDLVQTAVNISLDDGSSIGWDPARNSLLVLDQPERAERNRQTIAVMRDIVANLTRRPWPELKQVSGFDATEPWISVVDFAASEKMSLWCDDFYLRELAKSSGVHAFSTGDVLEQLELTSRVTPTDADVIRLAFARASYIDLQYSHDLLSLAAATDGYSPLGVADIVSHPSSWSDPAPTMRLVAETLSRLPRDRFEDFQIWVSAAAMGLNAASTDMASSQNNLSVLLENVLSLEWMDPEHVPLALLGVRSAVRSPEGDPWEVTLRRIYGKIRTRYAPAASASILMASIRLCPADDCRVAARIIFTDDL